jgi:acyl dehydratase
MADRITDEGIELLRKRIGIPRPHSAPPHYLKPNEDAFRHVAMAYGDDNPLWCDPDYGKSTRWGGPIASPHFVGGDTLIGEDEVSRIPDEQRDLMRGDPLGGVHAFYAGSFREWWHPLRPDSTVLRRNALIGVHDKVGEFAGRAVHEWFGEVFALADGPVLSGQYRLMIRAEREKALERKTNDSVEIAPYTDDEIAMISEQIDQERSRRRGALTRYWEDVAVDDEIGPLVKGPLRVTDMVVWHTGMGMGLYGVSALRLANDQRKRMPKFFKPDDLNIPDVQQRVHWDPEWARQAGNPACYDYGRMRETWLIHLCTDWMGDDAWLWKLDCEFRKFNYVGDTHWVHGRVIKKYLADGDRPAVDLEIWGQNQRSERTTPGHATILLPSREFGEVKLPEPPGNAGNCQELLDALASRFASENQ